MSTSRERVKQALNEIEGESSQPEAENPPQQGPQVRAVDLLTLLALLTTPPTPEEKRKLMFIQIVEENIMLREDARLKDLGYTTCGKCGWHHVPPS
jgi:hypothetical protein